MLSKKFDQFDLILDDINLELREFEEARFWYKISRTFLLKTYLQI